MDIVKNNGDHNSMTVGNLKDALESIDNDLLVIFEYVVNEDTGPIASHSIDAISVRGGFYILTSLDT